MKGKYLNQTKNAPSRLRARGMVNRANQIEKTPAAE